MKENELPPVTQQELIATERLQKASVEAYLEVTKSLQIGMSEQQIADKVKDQLAQRGVVQFWYNIPIMVLIGPERFLQMTAKNYDEKRPRDNVQLQEGSVMYVDMHPQDVTTSRWGNFAATGIFHPREDQVEEIQMLKDMQEIQESGIRRINSSQTGAQIADMLSQSFVQAGAAVVDPRGNFGHRMHAGPKNWDAVVYPFLDEKHTASIAGQIVGIEVGGIRRGKVARFEDCVHVPESGSARILGRRQPVPVVFP